MPHHRHLKNSRVRHESSSETVIDNAAQPHGNGHHFVEAAPRVQDEHAADCCMPTGCLQNGETIDPSDPCQSVKVVCNNDQCNQSVWMHKICFEEWQESVLNYLRSCGRARSWSEKQRLQNLWTKKGYDLAFKACDCKCGRGHIRKDLDYIPPPKTEKKGKKKPKKNDKPMPVMSTMKSTNSNAVLQHVGSPSHNGNHHGDLSLPHTAVNQNDNAYFRNNVWRAETQKLDNKPVRTSQPIDKTPNKTTSVTNGNIWGSKSSNDDNNNADSTFAVSKPINAKTVMIRQRTDSLESASSGSSPPNSIGSSSPSSSSPVPDNNNSILGAAVRTQKPKFDSLTESNITNLNNLFRRRLDFSAFNVLPRHKQNPYHIKIEDEQTMGNDETRSFVLSHLGTYKISSLNCVLCKRGMPVFDRYPLVDGTFFLSPQAYSDGVVQVISEGRLQYINAVCVQCLEGATDVSCISCKRKWDGSTLLLGSMYSYDIFAAMPCCQKRLTCKHCRRAVVDVTSGLTFYSEYSHMIACPYCKAHDYHFIRPMSETFSVKKPIWN